MLIFVNNITMLGLPKQLEYKGQIHDSNHSNTWQIELVSRFYLLMNLNDWEKCNKNKLFKTNLEFRFVFVVIYGRSNPSLNTVRPSINCEKILTTFIIFLTGMQLSTIFR